MTDTLYQTHWTFLKLKSRGKLLEVAQGVCALFELGITVNVEISLQPIRRLFSWMLCHTADVLRHCKDFFVNIACRSLNGCVIFLKETKNIHAHTRQLECVVNPISKCKFVVIGIRTILASKQYTRTSLKDRF